MFDFLKPNLKLCILLDAIGMVSFLIPGIGEGFDAVWAPISGFLFLIMFKSPMGALLAGAEEIIPFTDIIPSFTIGYFLLYKFKKQDKAKDIEYTTYEEVKEQKPTRLSIMNK